MQKYLKYWKFENLKSYAQSLLYPGPNIIPEITGVRTILILSVFYAHGLLLFHMIYPRSYTENLLSNSISTYNLYAYFALDAFFALSGFLIAGAYVKYARGKYAVRKFLLNRLFRIWPVYFLGMILASFVLRENIEFIWGNLLMIHNNFWINRFMPWSWSVSLEEQFYFLFPLLYLCLKKKNNFTVIIMLFLFFFVLRLCFLLFFAEGIPFFHTSRPLVVEDHQLLYFSTPFRIGAFFPGIFLYYYQEKIKNKSIAPWKIKVALSLSLIVMGTLINGHELIEFFNLGDLAFRYYYGVGHYFFSIGFSLFLFVILNSKGKAWLKLFDNRFSYCIGLLSYTLYIFHPIFLYSTLVMLVQSGQPELTASWYYWKSTQVLIFSLLFSAIIYIIVEKPFLEMRKEFFRSRV